MAIPLPLREPPPEYVALVARYDRLLAACEPCRARDPAVYVVTRPRRATPEPAR